MSEWFTRLTKKERKEKEVGKIDPSSLSRSEKDRRLNILNAFIFSSKEEILKAKENFVKDSIEDRVLDDLLLSLEEEGVENTGDLSY